MTTESIIATIEFDQSGAPSDEAAAVATVEDILTAMRDGLAVMVQVESPDGGKNYFDVTSSPAGAYKAKRLGSNMGSRA